jgi:hypothetical protein
LVYKREK